VGSSTSWEFADGTAFGESVSRTLTTAGVHAATVTVTDDEGDTATDTVSVTVTAPANEPPVIREATADRTTGHAPLDVWFQAVADDPEGGKLTYKWEFGDAPGSALGAEADHTYLSPGTFTAKVTVTDAGGATDTEEITITVTNPPGNRAPAVEAAALPASGQAPLEVQFSAQGSDPDGDALSYAWDFGDGSAEAKGRRARHVYTQTGTFSAKVTATDKAGNTATDAVEVVVGNPPANQAPTVQAAADPAGGTAPLKVNFSAAADDPDGDAMSYVWDFGDGGKAGGSKDTHTFAAAGSYTVSVTVTDTEGSTGVATLTLVVTAPMQAAVATPVAPPPAVAKSALEAIAPASIATFARRGVKVTLSCAAGGVGHAQLRVSKAGARRLALSRRALASRQVTCVEGETVAVRVKPSGRVRRAIRAERPKSLRLTLGLAFPGGDKLQRKLTLRR
jgi:large repetitive protein